MADFLETEHKYRADSVKLTDFQKLLTSLGYLRKLDISSWDQYYKSNKDEDSFLRLRLSETPELTTKVKTKESNNYVRIELDIPLDSSRLNEDIVDKFAEVLDYSKSARLYKSCFVFWREKINYVFYCVYDRDLNELGRFVEIECNKGKGASYEDLLEAEKTLTTVGLTPQHRLKKSLFELYVK